MRIIGLRRPHIGSGVEVAALAELDNEVTVIASLADFWADPAGYRKPVTATINCRRIQLCSPGGHSP